MSGCFLLEIFLERHQAGSGEEKVLFALPNEGVGQETWMDSNEEACLLIPIKS